jgi:diguanylate cyclase (GGDEF)-like protein
MKQDFRRDGELNISRKAKVIIWLSWVLLFPFVTWQLYRLSPPDINHADWDVVGFLLLICIVAALPIIVNDTPIFFTQGVSVAVFLTFGLFIEFVLTQIALVVLLLRLRMGLKDIHRLPLNSLMFAIVSIVSALIFYALGGHHGEQIYASFGGFFLIMAYQLSLFITNHFLIYLIRRFIYRSNIRFISNDLMWEIYTSLYIFPVGLLLYMLYSELGTVALFFVGIPFVSLAIIIKLYFSSERVNDYLQKASEIGHQLTERLKVDEVLDVFIEKLSAIFPVDYAYIFEVKHQKSLTLLRYVEQGIEKELHVNPIQKYEGILGQVFGTKKPHLYLTNQEWKKTKDLFFPHTVESIMAIPIVRNQEVVGVVALASNQKRAYEKYQCMIVDMLTSYLGVALENARHYEETKNKSERCPLTKLYNYRYFENLLEENFRLLMSGHSMEKLSLILLDIDHFKSVNDTYGHQSGNEVLCELANRLVKTIGQKGTVARYGGEEFVILLPNVDRDTCYEIAENLRKDIGDHPFTIHDHLNDHHREISLQITVSIGFATAPDDADDPLSLLRYADRAMYMGAKKAGRNRVAAYVK